VTTGQLLYKIFKKLLSCEKQQLKFAPPENTISSIDIRGSIHGDAQVMSHSTLSLFLDFVFMAK